LPELERASLAQAEGGRDIRPNTGAMSKGPSLHCIQVWCIDELAVRFLSEVLLVEVSRAELAAHRVTGAIVDAGGDVALALALVLAGVVVVAVEADVVAVRLAAQA